MSDTIEISAEDLAEMRAELASLRANVRPITIKVSVPKGAVQIDGLRRLPIVLYAGEWETLFGMRDEITAFIAANTGRLTRKG